MAKGVMTPPQSHLGKVREDPKPRPLRFRTVQDAKAHIKANGLKVTEHNSHSRGVRISVVDAKGKVRTLSIPKEKKAPSGDAS